VVKNSAFLRPSWRVYLEANGGHNLFVNDAKQEGYVDLATWRLELARFLVRVGAFI